LNASQDDVRDAVSEQKKKVLPQKKQQIMERGQLIILCKAREGQLMHKKAHIGTGGSTVGS
jgi:hypothetical protein